MTPHLLRIAGAVALGLGACGVPRQETGGREPSFPQSFTAAMDTFFGMDVELHGVVERHGNTLVVRVDSSHFRWLDDGGWPFNQPESDVIRVVVGAGSRDGTWELRESSAPARVASLREPGQSRLRSPTTFRIPLRPGEPLAGRWLVFALGTRSQDASGEWTTGYSFAHAEELSGP